MTDNTPTIATGAKEFGEISNNPGVVIGDASGHVNVIGGSCRRQRPFHTNVDRLANNPSLPPKQVARSITIRPDPDREGRRVSGVP